MTPRYPISVTPEVSELLGAGAVVAAGVSGGKDSHALPIRLAKYLDDIGHRGPRLLIHSDLGSVEWEDSIRVCQRVAARIGWELVVVRRQAGDLMQRWEARWANCLDRYVTLSCVKLILPWSTPGMRFCTSELKTDIICAELTRRFPGQAILSATGIRHVESTARAAMPAVQPQPKLSRRGCKGWNWNPIIEWDTPDVFAYLAEHDETLHEAYTRYGSTRVSCAFCIMGSGGDLAASARCEANGAIYRRMVDLEIRSTFALQGSRWLGDVAPHLLAAETRDALAHAKVRAQERSKAEARLPKSLLFSKGWPSAVPSLADARLIAEVRRDVARAVGIDVGFVTADAVIERYRELLDQKAAKMPLAA